MAITCDSDLGTETPSASDPFEEKAQASENLRIRSFAVFTALRNSSPSDLRDTTLVELFIVHSIHFLDPDMMAILKMSNADGRHRQVYFSLVHVAHNAARILRARVHAPLLRHMPLTNVREICYQIADQFEGLFFAPTLPLLPSLSEVAVLFNWHDRFNSMWPIVSLLSREYTRLGLQ